MRKPKEGERINKKAWEKHLRKGAEKRKAANKLARATRRKQRRG